MKGIGVLSHKLKLKKMRAELANLNYCAVPFLSRAVEKLVLVIFYMMFICFQEDLRNDFGLPTSCCVPVEFETLTYPVFTDNRNIEIREVSVCSQRVREREREKEKERILHSTTTL